MIRPFMLRTLFTSILLFPLVINATTFPTDGIYLDFHSFRRGMPNLTLSNLFKDAQGTQSVSSYRMWFKSERRYFKNDSAKVIEFGETPVWGYVENGTVHVLINGKFHKILLFGQISYLLESYPKEKGQMSPVVTDGKTISNYRLLDMQTGRLSTYEPGRLETLMKDDEELLAEFRSITSAKTKEKRMYSFIERFNQKHPLLPVSE